MGSDFATNGKQTATNPFAVYGERAQLTKLESTLDREALPLSQGMHMKVLSKLYCDRVYFCAPSGLRQGQVFTRPPPPPAARPRHRPMEVPPPPPLRG